MPGWTRCGRSELVDPERVAAIGYCFGGTTVLELARSGADLNGRREFSRRIGFAQPGRRQKHQMQGADPAMARMIRFQKPEDIAAFEDEMRNGGVDWRLIKYGGAVHSLHPMECRQRQCEGRGIQRARRPAFLGGYEIVFRRDF